MSIGYLAILAFVTSLLASIGLTPLAIRLAKSFGILDLPNARKVHSTPTPRIGGVAFGLTMLMVALPLLFFAGGFDRPDAISRSKVLAFAAGGLAVLLVGLADDIFNIASQWKLLALLAASVAVCSAGVQIDGLNLAHGVHVSFGLAAWPVTILWIIAITVSINFIDGLDGLAGGIGAMACIALGVTSAIAGQAPVAVLSLSLLGGLMGFLVFNFEPAKVFMGDSGSLFLGFCLATLSVLSAQRVGTTSGLLLPALVLSVPLGDTVLTFIRRGVMQRRSIFSAERGHIHHRLIELGLCPKHAVLLLYGVTAAAACVGAIGIFGGRWTLIGGLFILSVLMAGFFRMSGSVRMRATLAAVRRNRSISRESNRYRRAFEESQLRFRLIQNFDQWWQEVCTAAEQLDFVALTLPLTNRDGSARTLKWRRTDSQFGNCETMGATLPIRQRRHNSLLQAEMEVAIHTALESAGSRVALFSRLVGENSIADLPEPKDEIPTVDTANPEVESFDEPPANAAHPSVEHAGQESQVGLSDAKRALNEALHAFETGSDGEQAIEPITELCSLDGKPLRVAVVHDFLYTYAGAERVLEQILNVFPKADLFSLFDFLEPHQRGFIKNKTVTTSFIQKLPFARKKHRAYLPLMPLAAEQLDVSAYDIVISSSYVAAKGIITRPGQLHVCYCHTPIRFAWDMQHQYLREAGVRGIKSLFARAILHYIRQWDSRSAAGVDVFVTNSRFVSARVEKFYRRSSTTIYPPVDVEKFKIGTEREDYYLTASRMVPYKRIDLIVEAFSKTPNRRLIVVGEGPDFEKIKAKAGPNVRLVGRVSEERIRGYMQRAKAFVFAAEEDFGIVPVEAQACGTPVIAYGRGGATESVIDGKTGIYFPEQTIESLNEAVDRFEEQEWDSAAIRTNAERFSGRSFRRRFRALVSREYVQFVGDHAEGLKLVADQTAAQPKWNSKNGDDESQDREQGTLSIA